jgi:hypothetical protein
MDNSFTEIERVARYLISERTAPTHTMPPQRRRAQWATTLRRVADRLDN